MGYRKGPKGGIWYYRFVGPDGRYIKRTLGKADDHQDANGRDVLNFKTAQLRAIEASEARTPESGALPSEPTVSDVMHSYLAWARNHKKAASFYDTKVKTERHVLPSLGRFSVNDLTGKKLRNWRDALAVTESHDPDVRRKKRATANRVFTILRAALNRAYHEEEGEGSTIRSAEAWKKVKAFRDVDAPRIRYLTRDEARRLINACAPDFRELVQGALMTACRYGELIAMKVGDYDSDNASIYIPHPKSERARHVHLSAEGKALFDRFTAGRKAGELMFQRADGESWGQQDQKRRMKEACTAGKIAPPIGFHGLRHTVASLLAMEGVPLSVVAQALGHADQRLCERYYAHLSPSFVAETIRKNLPVFGIKQDNVRKIGQ